MLDMTLDRTRMDDRQFERQRVVDSRVLDAMDETGAVRPAPTVRRAVAEDAHRFGP